MSSIKTSFNHSEPHKHQPKEASCLFNGTTRHQPSPDLFLDCDESVSSSIPRLANWPTGQLDDSIEHHAIWPAGAQRLEASSESRSGRFQRTSRPDQVLKGALDQSIILLGKENIVAIIAQSSELGCAFKVRTSSELLQK